MTRNKNDLIFKQIKFYGKLFNCQSNFDYIKKCNIKINTLVGVLNSTTSRDDHLCCDYCDLPMTDIDFHCDLHCKYCYLTNYKIDI